MTISIIAALGNNRVIGKDNALPWKLPADMERFHQLTRGKTVIMGQRTFVSIGRALPGRTNIVLTLDKDFLAEDCFIAHSIEEALAIASKKDGQEAMIIGGALIYKQFLPLVDKMYLTLIDADFAGDAFFPEFDHEQWEEIERIENEPDKNNHYRYTFLSLKRR